MKHFLLLAVVVEAEEKKVEILTGSVVAVAVAPVLKIRLRDVEEDEKERLDGERNNVNEVEDAIVALPAFDMRLCFNYF